VSRLANQVRVSALAGVQPALQIVLVTVAIIPVRVIINRVFGSDAAIDWRLSLVVGGSIALMWYVSICASTFVDMRREAAHGRQIRQSFPATAFVAGLYGVTVLFSAAMAVGMYREGDPAWLQVIPLCFVLIAFYGWPRTIHIDQSSIWQRSRLGRRTCINYTDVVAVAHAVDTTTVAGSSGIIEHTQYHAVSGEFAGLVSARTGKQVY
jgi:hypothetical protein